MQSHVQLRVGDTLTISVVGDYAELPPTPEPVEGLEVMLQVGGVNIYTNDDQSYVCFTSDLSICNDGTGPAHGDPHHQSQTAYWDGGKCLNADEDRYIVVPPLVRRMVPGVFMG